jgi:hypothetical protein
MEEASSSRSVLFDPLIPLSEEDIAAIETLCEAAGPWPLVADDVALGEGVIVATLPDGRHVVSLAPAGTTDDPDWEPANTRLICQGRYFLRRLLNDRRRRQDECEQLRARVEALEAELDESGEIQLQRRPR